MSVTSTNGPPSPSPCGPARGHDFRPAYLTLGELKTDFPFVPIAWWVLPWARPERLRCRRVGNRCRPTSLAFASAMSYAMSYEATYRGLPRDHDALPCVKLLPPSKARPAPLPPPLPPAA
jgi:hypothetical protein